MSHLGRPDGTVNEKFTLKPVADKLQELLGRDVKFLPDCVGDDITKAVDAGKDGQVFLLENLRFHIEEEGKGVINGEKVKAKDEDVKKFRAGLTALGDVYINDAWVPAVSPLTSASVPPTVPTRPWSASTFPSVLLAS